MKRILSMLLLLSIMLSLCGCNSDKYAQAVELLDNKDFESAITIFEELAAKNYKDSAEKLNEAKYAQADVYFEKEEYESALTILNELSADNYKDSEKKAKYVQGISYFKSKDYDSALPIFIGLKRDEYKDSSEWLNETKYAKATSSLVSKEYKIAIPIFEELAKLNYKDSSDKLVETKYRFVTNNKDNENKEVLKYLTELSEANYKDSKSIYKELYMWKCEIAFNTDKGSMVHESTVKASTKLFPFYFINFRITGGKPGESLRGEYVITYSNGQEVRGKFSDGGGAVLSITCSTTEAPIGETIFTLYDSDGKRLDMNSSIIR